MIHLECFKSNILKNMNSSLTSQNRGAQPARDNIFKKLNSSPMSQKLHPTRIMQNNFELVQINHFYAS